MFTFLKRVDPEENMDRWYMVFVQASLLDPVAVICAWGSRRNRYQRLRVLPAESQAEALAIAQQVIQQKLTRGYEVVREVDNVDFRSASSLKSSHSLSLPAATAAVLPGRGPAKVLRVPIR